MIKMIKKKDDILSIFSELSKKIPKPAIELDYINPYTLLVAIILSAQATDKGVNKATPALFAIVNSPEEMLKLGEEGLKGYIKTIGLYNSKAKNIIAMSQRLVDHHNGEVPNNREDLMKLPGVGRKSANVLLNSVWGMPTIAVDTHVFRVSNRIGLCNEKIPEKTELALENLLNGIMQDEEKRAVHHLLVLHGRYTCLARKPKCHDCPLTRWCGYYKTVKDEER